MAAMTAWLRYADDVRPVAVKLSTWKGSGAHPKHARAGNRTGEATLKLVVGHSNHGGANNVGYGAPVVAVDKMVNQSGTKHHGIVAKLKQDFARSEAHRRATATVKRTRRRCYRLRGRRATNGVSQRIQASMAGRLSAQGASVALTGFAEAGMRYEDDASSTELWRRRREKLRR